MSASEGVTRFRCQHIAGSPPVDAGIGDLLEWRLRLRDSGLLGVDAHGFGYGNLSIRSVGGFIITGTQSSGLPEIGAEHLTEVIAADIEGNALTCRGPVAASSESLTHAAVYAAEPAALAVVHGHHAAVWWRLIGSAPTASARAEYGTPAMAREIERLIRAGETRAERLIVMAGHVEGLISFGSSMEEAATRLLRERERM